MGKMPPIPHRPLGERNPNVQGIERASKARNREKSREEEQSRQEEQSRKEEQSHKEESKSSPSSKKRKSSSAEEEVNLDEVEIPDGTPLRWDANQIRNKIRTMLNNSDMTVAKMMEAIDTTSNSYYRFMNQSGPTKGTQSDVYMNANVYFTKREIAGLKMPRKKKAKTEASDSKADAKELDVSGIELEGDENDSVPIYLTCDDVRSLINNHLRTTSATQASFCRIVNGMYTHQPSEGTGPGALKTFLSSSGVLMGASSPIFYGSYVYFEKLRIKQKKPQNKKRQEMEKMWAPRGLDTHCDMKQSIVMRAGEAIFTDKYGHVEFHPLGWPAPDGWKAWKPTKMGK